MSRIRTIKPEFWKHEELSALPEATHMLAAALLNYADDEGFFNANPRLVQSECVPLREPSVSVHDSLKLLASIGYLKVGKGVDGKVYGHIIKFNDHQRVNRPVASKINKIKIAWEDAPTTHTLLTEASSPEGNGKGREEEGEKEGSEAKASGADAPLDPEKELFDRGKAVLGKDAGGLIARLLKVRGGKIALARAAIETASTKQNPREYIGAIVRGTGPPDELGYQTVGL